MQIQSQQRSALAERLSSNRSAGTIREMSTPQTTFLLAVYDLEEMRTLRHKPSRLMHYFANQSVTDSALVGTLDAIAAKVRKRAQRAYCEEGQGLPHMRRSPRCS